VDKSILLIFLGASFVLSSVIVRSPIAQKRPLLFRIEDSLTGEQGYATRFGDTVIALGKYGHCFSEIFEDFAIVLAHGQFIAIDRNERMLFEVYRFENGPDYPSEGLFRILQDGKIGFADLKGKVVIKPQFDGAFPFEHGRSQVCIGCTSRKVSDEYSTWFGGKWYDINKRGKKLKP
jgi:hypothetical protein